MIDLAGSERASVTKNRGDRLKEGANINRSLLALANCINTLATNGSRASSRRMVRVKYRDSKLTHLLKSSLEGNCRLVMITCVAPAHLSYEESHNSLKYSLAVSQYPYYPRLLLQEISRFDRLHRSQQ